MTAWGEVDVKALSSQPINPMNGWLEKQSMF